MRSLTLCALAGVTLLTLACGRSSAPTQPATGPESPALGAVAPDALLQHVAGRYRVTVDVDALTADVIPLAQRTVQQSELFTLSIEEFLRPNTFKIVGVTSDADSIDLTYVTTHPFAAPTNLDGPPSGGNRADLAVTGRVLWLIDDPDLVPYFASSDAVSVNTRLVHNADGYLMPGALVSDPGTAANTFPFQLLTNEALDNREGLSNGGSVTGNYGAQGWQVSEFTDGITGYGIWGQGQSTRHTIELDRAEISTAGSFTVDTAIVVKYEDPRGGTTGVERRGNRLPSNDVAKFAYRMPHGALDVESVRFGTSDTNFTEGELGIVLMSAQVVDWDARATEAPMAHLADETDPSLVSAGESGVPLLDLDIPGIADSEGDLFAVVDDDSAIGGDPEADSGRPLDALYYQGTISGTPATSGTFTGLLRAIDPTDVSPPANWDLVRRNLAPDLSPLSTIIEGTVYQAFSIDVETASQPPVASWAFTGGQVVSCGSTTTIELTTPVLGSGNMSGNYETSIDWDDGSPIVPELENISGGPQQYTHTYVYSGTPPNPQLRTISVTLTDADDPLQTGPATPPADPMVTVNEATTSPGWAKRFGGSNLDFGFDLDVDSSGNAVLVGGCFSTVDFGGGPLTNGGSSDPFVAKFDASGTHLWSKSFPGVGNDFFRAVAVDSLGNVYAHGEFEGTLNFGGAPLASAGAQDAVLVKWDAGGNFQWAQRFGGAGSETSTGAICDASDRILFSGYSYSGAFSFGGPPTVFSPHYLVRFTPAGSYDGQYTVNCGGASTGGFGLIPGGGMVLTGQFSVYAPGSVSFGGPARQTTGGTGTDVYAVALNDSFGYLWDYVAGGTGFDSGQGACTLTNGTTIVVGHFAGTATFGTSTFISSGAQDLFLVRLSNTGAQLSANQYGGTGSDNAYDVVADSLDRYIFVGSVSGSANFGGPSNVSGAAAVQYDASGAWQWNNGYGTTASARGVGYGPCDRPVIGGDFQSIADFQPGAGTFNLTSAGSLDPFITGINSNGNW